MATGIGASVVILGKMLKLATESSAHMAATQKLWDTSIRMIFRPMGDTIGLILRPFALMMLRWALPFYRDFTQNIDKIQSGGEKLAKGDIIGGGNDIQAGIIGTLFGQEARANLEKNQRAFDDAGQSIIDFFSNFELFPSAFGDTGESADNARVSITGLKNELSLFEQVSSKLQDVIEQKSLTGLGADFGEGSGITAGGHSSNRGRTTSTQKTLSRAEFNNLRKYLGNRGAMEEMERNGLSLAGRESEPNSRQENRRGSGVTVNLNGAILEDPNLGRKIQEEIQRELKKIPGHR